MEFRVLGPLEVVENGEAVPVKGEKQRALLAALCLRANEVVSSDRLIDALWADDAPQDPQASLQFHVSQLRKLLGSERIETRPPGYLLRLVPDELDVARFERLIENDRFDEALALWRGPALADFEYTSFAQGEIARLEELRVAALEEWIDAELARGRHAEVVGELEALVREHPLRERLRGQLMLALYRCGRQAEALDVYRQTRELLVEELGIDPGEALQQLERQILNQDPALAGPAPEPAPESPVAVREERKLVTALSCELLGVSAGDPEELRDRLAPLEVRLRAELERHGGTVEHVVGNTVLAVFGAPVAHEDDPERALRSALAVRDWIAELPEDFEVRIGIATGEALVGGEEGLVGAVVGTAALLREGAPPGGVVVGEATHRATAKAVAYEQVEPGRWVAKQLSARPIGLVTAAAPFVGRDAELELVRQAYARAVRESSVQLVTIVGEPGIGKTRLAAELRQLLDDAVWRQGRCLPYGEGITFWALGEIVKAHAEILESDSAEAAAAKLERATGAVNESERSWVLERLRPLVGAGSAPATERSESFAAWRSFFEAVASEQPLVLLVEDLHWADSALLEFLLDLVDRSTDVPLLLVGTARPELYDQDPAWGGGKRNATTVSLSPLSAEDTGRLVAALGADEPAEVIERAGGNPLYAEELVRMSGEPIPETLHALIAARLDTLDAGRKSLLQDAAVVGKVFWAGALASMTGIPQEAVLERLHELGQKEFVRRARASSFADDVEYTFWHELIRDVAYGQLPRAERARKHVAAAEWIERRAERPTDVAELLAHHYSTALELVGDGDQALEQRAGQFLVLAARRAIGLDYAHGDQLYRQALALMREDDPNRPRILAEVAGAATTGGAEFEQIRAELEEAIDALQEQGDTIAAADAMRRLSFALYSQPESLELVEEARELLEPLPPSRELALVYERLSHEHSLAGREEEALEWGEKAVPLLDRFALEDDALRQRARNVWSRLVLGDLDAIEEARELVRAAMDPGRGFGTWAITGALNNLGASETWFGAGPAAGAKALRTAAELAPRRGLERLTRWYKANLCEPLYDLGAWDEALRIAGEIAAWERVGVIAQTPAVRILVARGELDRADGVLEALLPQARAWEGGLMLCSALTAAGALAAAQGDHPKAVSHVEEFERLASGDMPVLGYVPEICRVCARTGAVGVLERLVAAAAELDPRLDRFAATVWAILAEARGESEEAGSLYARAEQGWNEHDGVVERAHALLGLGRTSGAETPLHEAEAIFERLGARSARDEARALLSA